MTDAPTLTALVRLLTWLSPAFPIGAFAYSGGLERAVHDRLVVDAASLENWIATLIGHGSLWNDAVLMAEAYHGQADRDRLAAAAELAAALAGSGERFTETTLLGEAFVSAAQAWPHPLLADLPMPLAYPVAVGALAGMHGVALPPAIAGFLHAAMAQLTSAGIRLGVIGQKDGVGILARLEALAVAVAERAAASTLDDLGSASIEADIATLRHETQAVRLFRS